MMQKKNEISRETYDEESAVEDAAANSGSFILGMSNRRRCIKNRQCAQNIPKNSLAQKTHSRQGHAPEFPFSLHFGILHAKFTFFKI
jgi:hypothetical protein